VEACRRTLSHASRPCLNLTTHPADNLFVTADRTEKYLPISKTMIQSPGSSTVVVGTYSLRTPRVV